jgi:hypothetical protein
VTASFPEDRDDRDLDPSPADAAADPSEPAERTERKFDDADVDAEFRSIIAGMGGTMKWDVDSRELDTAATDGTPAPVEDDAEARKTRRQLRREERAAEYAEYLAAEAERENESKLDDEHYVPEEPPPLQMPKPRTVWAFVLIFAGVFLMAGPNLLRINGDATLILGLLLVLGGFTLLMLGLRRHHGTPGEADGWDDGARR